MKGVSIIWVYLVHNKWASWGLAKRCTLQRGGEQHGEAVTNGATSSCLLHIPRDSVQGRPIKNVRGNLAQGCPSAMNWFSYGIDPLLCFLQRRLYNIAEEFPSLHSLSTARWSAAAGGGWHRWQQNATRFLAPSHYFFYCPHNIEAGMAIITLLSPFIPTIQYQTQGFPSVRLSVRP